MSVRVILDIPDEIAAQLSVRGQELSRAALEALALESYRRGRLTHDLGRSPETEFVTLLDQGEAEAIQLALHLHRTSPRYPQGPS